MKKKIKKLKKEVKNLKWLVQMVLDNLAQLETPVVVEEKKE